ncbi:hypothetical protein [Parerythrobacter jejuensis]|uniref:Uncharacterized protein n=1 Tax=Parerythrobacter jejuensis TaxID=795812 RepID=A0A845ASY9_9SPHN|nr:hypothetical protein [Parerythrobacter jejuensis]MXP32714.1 hypothetical protein [Parerythrobacter jejuensis]
MTISRRIPALLALAIPTLAGLAYLIAFAAPSQFLWVNAGALLVAAGWILFGSAPSTRRGKRIAVLALLALLFLPLITGPEYNGIARWVPMGPFTLHAASFAFPALAVLAAQDDDFAPPMLLAALLAASIQPDAALGFAVVFAAVGLHDVTRDWRIGVTFMIGFFASLVMALRGELPAQPFVERIIDDLLRTDPLVAIGLLVALVAGFFLMGYSAPMERRARYGLAGSFFGFSIMGILSNYPSVMIGYGAAPILGYGLALGLAQQEITHEAPV